MGVGQQAPGKETEWRDIEGCGSVGCQEGPGELWRQPMPPGEESMEGDEVLHPLSLLARLSILPTPALPQSPPDFSWKVFAEQVPGGAARVRTCVVNESQRPGRLPQRVFGRLK